MHQFCLAVLHIVSSLDSLHTSRCCYYFSGIKCDKNSAAFRKIIILREHRKLQKCVVTTLECAFLFIVFEKTLHTEILFFLLIA